MVYPGRACVRAVLQIILVIIVSSVLVHTHIACFEIPLEHLCTFIYTHDMRSAQELQLASATRHMDLSSTATPDPCNKPPLRYQLCRILQVTLCMRISTRACLRINFVRYHCTRMLGNPIARYMCNQGLLIRALLIFQRNCRKLLLISLNVVCKLQMRLPCLKCAFDPLLVVAGCPHIKCFAPNLRKLVTSSHKSLQHQLTSLQHTQHLTCLGTVTANLPCVFVLVLY